MRVPCQSPVLVTSGQGVDQAGAKAAEITGSTFLVSELSSSLIPKSKLSPASLPRQRKGMYSAAPVGLRIDPEFFSPNVRLRRPERRETRQH